MRKKDRDSGGPSLQDKGPSYGDLQGVWNLARKYGAQPVYDACRAALDVGVTTYCFVRRYLERPPSAPLTLKQLDPLIRHLTQYLDLIKRGTII